MLGFIPAGYSLEVGITWEEMREETTRRYARRKPNNTEELGGGGRVQQDGDGSALASANIAQSVCDSVNPL